MSFASQRELKKGALIALRTVPVVLKGNRHSIQCNALLDDCSTSTYINSDVANQMELNGKPDQLEVQVLNGATTNMNSSMVQFTIQSHDGRVQKTIAAHITNKVTGNIKVINWTEQKSNFQHLKNINFCEVGDRPNVDILIGADNAELLFSKEEIVGKPGGPIARLTPLGWTCIGPVLKDENASNQTHYTYF